MRFSVTKSYDFTMDLLDWINPENEGNVDQYVPTFVSRGTINGYVAVDPGSGNMVLEVKTGFLPGILGRAIITNVRNRYGQLVSRDGYGFLADYPAPQINAYGQITGYKYRLIESEVS